MFPAYIRTTRSWNIVSISYSLRRLLAEDLIGQSIMDAFHVDDQQVDARGVSKVRLKARSRTLAFVGIVVSMVDDQFLFLLSPEAESIFAAVQEGLRLDDFGDFFVGGDLLIQRKLNDIIILEAAEYARELANAKRELALALENISLITNFLAHDLSNVLSLIMFSAGRLPGLKAGPDVIAISETIISAARAGVQFSGTLAGIRSPEEVSIIDLKGWFNKNAAIFQAALRDNVSFGCEMEDQGLMIDVNPAGLTISILNLLTNACESMPDGGSINVRLGILEGQGGVPYVEICVADNGPGIPEAVLLEGRSTRTGAQVRRGFGLRSVSRFCQSHGGEMTISSKVGKGVQVSMVFPLAFTDDDNLEKVSDIGFCSS